MDELEYLTRRANLLGERETAQRALDRINRRIEELDIRKHSDEHNELLALIKKLITTTQ
jgi:hypothetical protein